MVREDGQSNKEVVREGQHNKVDRQRFCKVQKRSLINMDHNKQMYRIRRVVLRLGKQLL